MPTTGHGSSARLMGPAMTTRLYKYPPSYTEWKLFVQARQGILPPRKHENVKVLCLACGVPVDLSQCQRVTIGCVVSIIEKVEVEIQGQLFEELKHKFMPVSAKGPGCSDCCFKLAKITGRTGRIHARAVQDWLKRGIKSTSPTKRAAWIEVEPRNLPLETTVAYWR